MSLFSLTYINILLNRLRRGNDTVGDPHRAEIHRFELFELFILLALDKQVSIEQFEPTVSQSTVSSPPLADVLFLVALRHSRLFSSRPCAMPDSRSLRSARHLLRYPGPRSDFVSGPFHYIVMVMYIRLLATVSSCSLASPRQLVSLSGSVRAISARLHYHYTSYHVVYVYIYIYIHTYTYTYMNTYMYICVYMCMCVYIYIYIHVRTHFTWLLPHMSLPRAHPFRSRIPFGDHLLKLERCGED